MAKGIREGLAEGGHLPTMGSLAQDRKRKLFMEEVELLLARHALLLGCRGYHWGQAAKECAESQARIHAPLPPYRLSIVIPPKVDRFQVIVTVSTGRKKE